MDKILGINTSGRDDTHSDRYKYPYEPTPYEVLERLAESGLVKEGDILLDYGCGKGRVEFFLSYKIGCKVIGVESEDEIYKAALDNKNSATDEGKVSFVLEKAERFTVPKEVNRIFFFNPFSEEILNSVLSNILDSYYEAPRQILLFFYYPSDEHIAKLMTSDEIMFYDEIDCTDLFPGDERERIMIFEVAGLE